MNREMRRAAAKQAKRPQRQRESGRVGCTGEERQSLLSLADVADQLRQAMPRRLWLKAMKSVYGSPRMEVSA